MVAAWVTSQIVFNGLVQGLVYGLLAMGIVLVYRTSRVINFALGAMGLIGSGLLVLLNVQYGVPYWIALAIALVAGVVYGGIIELAVVRRLFTAPRVILLVATIGVTQLSTAILLAFPDIDNARAGYPLPFDREFHIGDVRIKPALAAVVVVVPLVALGLTWFLTRTLIGRTVRAAAVNPDLARLRGVNPKSISTLVWAIGGGVATLAMVLIGGIDGSAGNLSGLGPGTLLRALTAALLARFISFRIALAAAVVIGLVEGVIRFNYLESPGLVDLLLLITVLIAVATTPRERGDAVFSFNPRIDVMPERLRSIFWVRHLDRIAMLTMLGLAVLAPFVFTKPSQHVVYASIAAFTICALSLTVLTGWAGQLSLGQMAFAGLGAFTGAAFTRGLEIDWFFYIRFEPVPFGLSILLAAVVVSAVAALVGSGALRVSGLLLAVSTFAFAVAAGAWIYLLDVFTPGQTALFPRGSILGLDLTTERTYYLAILTLLAVLVALLGRLRRSPVGRVTLAVRDNSTTAAAYTVRPSVVKLRTFALSGAIAGLGGGLLAGVAQRVSFADSRFAVAGSLLLVSVIVIGGMSSLSGAIIGSIYVV
ncbi:MAG: ABC transporter permease, partial [Vicinamibacterales bacterium]